MKELIDFNLIVIKDGWRTRNLQIMAYTKNYYAGDYVQVCNVAARASIHYCVFGMAVGRAKQIYDVYPLLLD